MEWNALLTKKRPDKDLNGDGLTDYDAIIRSTLFRRLQDKAQVFPLDNDDYVRTRLTHSLEVSAIGKNLDAMSFLPYRLKKQTRGLTAMAQMNFPIFSSVLV